jgi:hypothetical protein
MTFEYEGKTYTVGARVRFLYNRNPDKWVEGVIAFGKYDDNEGYADFEHFGYFVKFSMLDQDYNITFPDAVSQTLEVLE